MAEGIYHGERDLGRTPIGGFEYHRLVQVAGSEVPRRDPSGVGGVEFLTPMFSDIGGYFDGDKGTVVPCLSGIIADDVRQIRHVISPNLLFSCLALLCGGS